MKISAIYCLDYPDGHPKNPLIARGEIRVEVGEGKPTIEAFDSTYSFTVYTIEFLQQELQVGRKYVIDRATIIVERFDQAVIREAIESILDKLDCFGVKVG